MAFSTARGAAAPSPAVLGLPRWKTPGFSHGEDVNIYKKDSNP